ncbi:MAG: acyltransferase family protein [Bacteroidaceae bacterium]
MPATTSHRLLWLDMANILAMVGVVLFHIPTAIEQPYREEEFLVVNICFFFLAGCSFGVAGCHGSNVSQSARFLLRRVKRLLIPTLFFFSVFYILWLVVGRTLASDTELWHEPLLELLKGKLHTVIAPYWFVFCLLTMTVLYVFANIVIRNKIILSFVMGLVPLIDNLNIPDCYELRYACVFFPMFAFGSLLLRGDVSLKYIVFLLSGWIISMMTNYVIMGNANPSLVALAWGVIYTAVVVVISKSLARLAELRTVRLLRNGVLVLLATQSYIIGVCRIALDRIFGELDFLANHIILKPLILFVVYGLSIPLMWFVLRYMPFALGKGRKAQA